MKQLQVSKHGLYVRQIHFLLFGPIGIITTQHGCTSLIVPFDETRVLHKKSEFVKHTTHTTSKRVFHREPTLSSVDVI